MSAGTHDDDTLAAETGSELPIVSGRFAGRYTIERLLGYGAMGAVYGAHDDDVGERVAIKVLTTQTTPDALARFRREVRLARRVTHRNAARTYDLGTCGGYHYLTMELVDGGSLRERLRRDGILPFGQVASIVTQICRGLSAAHGVGVIHRDLKPANVLLEASGRCVITDFGVARGLDGDPELSTDHLAVVGTPAYMAPEQVKAGIIDARTDLYALGVMLYELVTGTRPFAGGTALELAIARLTVPPEDPRTHADIDDDLATLILECLSIEPDRRPASAAIVGRRLTAIAADTGGEIGTAAALSLPRANGSRAPTTGTTKRYGSLAVLPFSYRGPAEERYLAEALSEELIDVLSMTRGLKVPSAGANGRLAGERDPQKVGEILGVDAVVEGTIHRAGTDVRIVARLVAADSGFQLWSDRFDGQLQDVFDLQDRISRRVAEALRVEIEHREGTERVPEQAVDLYLRARARAKESDLYGDPLADAFAMLEESLRLAPDFAPALARAAQVAVLRSFIPVKSATRDWSETSEHAVAAALAGAPHLVDSQVAAARYYVSRGEIATAVSHITTALDIAPTCAVAHEYLGFLQCEAGHGDEGARHILLAHELDPSAVAHLTVVARLYALHGRWDEYTALMARLRAAPGVTMFVVDIMELRIAAWRGDMERVRSIRPGLGLAVGEPAAALPTILRAVGLGEMPPQEGIEKLNAFLASVKSARFRSAARQLSTEALCIVGEPELAVEELRKAYDEGVFIDADWMDRCPVLGPIRERPVFVEMHAAVRRAANAIWRTE